MTFNGAVPTKQEKAAPVGRRLFHRNNSAGFYQKAFKPIWICRG